MKLEMHPKAHLTTKRNVKAGLRARSRILFVLEEMKKPASEVAKASGLGYDCATYHLRSMMKERIVERSKQRPYIWAITRFGQQRLGS